MSEHERVRRAVTDNWHHFGRTFKAAKYAIRYYLANPADLEIELEAVEADLTRRGAVGRPQVLDENPHADLAAAASEIYELAQAGKTPAEIAEITRETAGGASWSADTIAYYSESPQLRAGGAWAQRLLFKMPASSRRPH